MLPSKKGVTLSVAGWQKLKDAIAQVDETIALLDS
jgi:Transcriptional Coactivator p15 (PC4)